MTSIDEQREFLLKHSRHPSNSGDPSSFDFQGSCKNPLCGDAVDVGINMVDGRISDLAIRASGCGISTASASLMTEIAKGKSSVELFETHELINNALTSSSTEPWPASLATLAPLARLRESPTRVPCALIAWFALSSALKSARP